MLTLSRGPNGVNVVDTMLVPEPGITRISRCQLTRTGATLDNRLVRVQLVAANADFHAANRASSGGALAAGLPGLMTSWLSELAGAPLGREDRR